jgi:hypothetical protein
VTLVRSVSFKKAFALIDVILEDTDTNVRLSDVVYVSPSNVVVPGSLLKTKVTLMMELSICAG